MRCPVDHEMELVSISVEGICVERCNKCNGHWLDHGELAKLAHRAEDVEPTISLSRKSTRFCPVDTSPLTEVEFKQQSGLRIDVCPVCQGIWLDVHELGQALTLLGRPPQPLISASPTRPVLDLLIRLNRSTSP